VNYSSVEYYYEDQNDVYYALYAWSEHNFADLETAGDKCDHRAFVDDLNNHCCSGPGNECKIDGEYNKICCASE